MKPLLYAAAALLLAIAAAAAEETPDVMFNSQELILGISIRGGVTVTPEAADYAVTELQANVTILPQQTPTQDVSFTTREPEPRQTDAGMLFRWEKPAAGKLEFLIEAEVLVRQHRPEVQDNVPFPLEDSSLPAEYLVPTANIDADSDAIIELASAIASGRSGLYDVVHALAQWTWENIQYNLSTLTADVTRNASWVLENRQGVCDEVSVLFIALNRALGIPARFVSGMAYTDSPLFPEQWGLHGWTEVYFPGTGWVPFDITYAEFGYVDASHIRLLAAPDPADTVTGYSWKGRNVHISTQELEVKAWLKEAGKRAMPGISLKATPFEEEVGFGAYNIVEAAVRNMQDAYVPATVSISKVSGTTLESPRQQHLLLRPLEERNTGFLFKVSNELDRNFQYTFPITLQAGTTTANTSFRAVASGVQPALRQLSELLKEDEPLHYEQLFSISCTAPEHVYIYDEARIRCTARNTGNVYLRQAEICSRSACATADIGIGRSRETVLVERFDHSGKQRIRITGETARASSATDIELLVMDMPAVNIAASAPSSVRFGKKFNMSITLEKTSFSTPENITVSIATPRNSASWNVDNLDAKRELIVPLLAEMLQEGKNIMRATVTYYDGNRRAYLNETEADVVLEKLTAFQKVQLAFVRLWTAIEHKFG